MLGVGLWFHVKTDLSYEHIISVPLNVAEKTGRFVAANAIPGSVRVRIRGTGKNLLYLPHRWRFEVAPRVRKHGTISVDITPADARGFEIGSGIEFVGVESPRSVLLDFDFNDTREVSVVPGLSVVPPPGYVVVGGITCYPRRVRISGPRRYVRGASSVRTDSLVKSGVREPVSLSMAVVLPPGVNMASTPDRVKLHVDVQPLLERRFEDVPVIVKHTPGGADVKTVPSVVTVDVVGGRRIIDALKRDEVKVSLDYHERFTKGLDDLPLKVDLPEYVSLVRAVPSKASLVISKKTRRRR
jgi:hypothetical protein